MAEDAIEAGERDGPLWWRRSEISTRDDFWLGLREALESGLRIAYAGHAAFEDELYFAMRVVPSEDDCAVRFATREAAQATCECHVQTSRWEPLPPVEVSGAALTNADAADLLNALACPLPWEDMSRRGCIAHLEAGGWYAVRREADGWQVVLASDGLCKGAYYPTRHAARVACEQHYLTGQWE